MEFKATVRNTNLIHKINNIYDDLNEEKNLSPEIKTILVLVEEKTKILDYLFLIFFIYLCFFEKPDWCLNEKDLMIEYCNKDIYGNIYNIFLVFSLNFKSLFALTAFVMCYFNLKYLIAFSFVQKDRPFF